MSLAGGTDCDKLIAYRQEDFHVTRRFADRTLGITVILLAIEFLDELVFGVNEAAWPFIRDDLGLTYVQIGILFSTPSIIGSLIELPLGILADVWRRRVLVLIGGVFFSAALFLVAMSASFPILLLAWIVFYPSSGAFVSLSQAALMDLQPDSHEVNMARWTFAGSLGVVVGPLFLSLVVFVGGSWRWVFIVLVTLSVLALILARQVPYKTSTPAAQSVRTLFRSGLKGALDALKDRAVWRWLILLQFSDLMLDVLYGYLALYFVDVAGATNTEAALAVAVWTGIGLLGDFLIIRLLEHISGLAYLRASALVELILFPAFLLIPGFAPKLAILGIIGLFNAGWYAILQGKLYSSMPGKSGTVMTVGNIAGLAGSLIPLIIGILAQQVGLQIAMWVLLLGPIALLLGLPGRTILLSAE